MVYLTRRYRFSASHRLHSDRLSAEENARIYGKCNNPYGHGHSYALDVTVAGPVDPATGMVFDLGVLDRLVQEEVLERLDYAHLNLDVSAFRQVVPTTENLCVEIYKLLRNKLGSSLGAAPGGSGSQPATTGNRARLKKVRLEETKSNYFEYEG